MMPVREGADASADLVEEAVTASDVVEEAAGGDGRADDCDLPVADLEEKVVASTIVGTPLLPSDASVDEADARDSNVAVKPYDPPCTKVGRNLSPGSLVILGFVV
jgi:hypothetical protein